MDITCRKMINRMKNLVTRFTPIIKLSATNLISNCDPNYQKKPCLFLHPKIKGQIEAMQRETKNKFMNKSDNSLPKK